MLTVTDINENVVEMFMYQWVNGNLQELLPIPGEIVINVVHEMLMTFMYCMEDLTF